MKEYDHDKGYVRETILIFVDPDLNEENFLIMKKKLRDYAGNHGEVINIEILKNEDGPGAIIQVVIVCFKSLFRLLEVRDVEYFRFIEKHKNDFEFFYRLLFVNF